MQYTPRCGAVHLRTVLYIWLYTWVCTLGCGFLHLWCWLWSGPVLGNLTFIAFLCRVILSALLKLPSNAPIAVHVSVHCSSVMYTWEDEAHPNGCSTPVLVAATSSSVWCCILKCCVTQCGAVHFSVVLDWRRSFSTFHHENYDGRAGNCGINVLAEAAAGSNKYWMLGQTLSCYVIEH